MATRTIKIGDNVTIKDGSIKTTIKDISRGKYLTAHSKELYDAGDLIAEKTKPTPKKKTQIKQVSEHQKPLNAIYSILRPDFLQHNRRCRARFAGCTDKATEVHHMYKRTGFWLIIMKYFFPICRNCHKYATKHSKEAVAAGVSVPRTLDLEYEFNNYERGLMAKYGVNPP